MRRPSWNALPVVVLLLAACGPTDGPRLYYRNDKAPSLSDEKLAALEHMGPTVVDQGVNFAVYSENATRIELLLFQDPESDVPTRQYELTRFGNVWNVHIEGVGYGQHYGFVAWGPNWPYDPSWRPGTTTGFVADVDGAGNRFNPNKLLFDPYGKALHRKHDWGRASTASGPKRHESTWGAGAKSVVVRSQYRWSAEEEAWRQARQDPNFEGHGRNDLIIYEVHPKGFTAGSGSGVEHPGTFRGIGEKADYFKELGITAVELLPVHEKSSTYWGYQSLSFFAPEMSYSSAVVFGKSPDPAAVIDEFKFMVEELHKRGIEVIIDVVYNHTGEGGLWREHIIAHGPSPDQAFAQAVVKLDPKEVAGLYSFRGLDNAAYYALSPDGQTYWNNTGVGNDTRPNHAPMRRLILDSLRYYVEELHVDGFRFDLAPILGQKDLDYNTWDELTNTVLQEIIDDPVLQKHNTRIISEPWSFAHYKLGGFPNNSEDPEAGWYDWNNRFRDWWRSFVNFDDYKLNSTEGDADGGFLLTAADRYFQWNGRKPYNSVNFVTVHDGFTMYDLFSYEQKVNTCGPLNPECCQVWYSPFCETDSGESHNRSRNWGQDNEPMKRQQMRNLFTALLIAHGTPMILGGDEWMRTQLGNNNAYSTMADNEFNWFSWGAWQASDFRHRMFDFVKELIQFRKDHAYAFAPMEYGQGAPFAWKSAQNGDMPAWGSKHLMIHYYDASVGPELAILINMESSQLPFTLPAGRTWRRVLDTQSYFDTDEYLAQQGLDLRRSANITRVDGADVTGGTYGVPSRSIVILEAAQ